MAAKTHPGLSVGTPARVDDESDLLVDEPTQESAPDTDPGRTGRKPDTDPGRTGRKPDTDPGRTGRKPDTDPGRSVHE
jgi:hypothetical protein